MNYKMVWYILGLMMKVNGFVLLVPLTVSMLFNESSAIMFLPSIALSHGIGNLLGQHIPEKKNIYAKEGMVIVAFSWLLFSLLGALPFYLSGAIPSFVDSFFETVSGFTTTGSTILQDIEVLPKRLLFWRSFTHWIGGMGVLVFALAVLPKTNARAMHIMRAEVPGPTVGKLVSRTKNTARILYGMYILLTVLEMLFLYFGGMPLFDSLLTSFSTAGTGGFAITNHSIASYNSYYIDMVISIFMLIFGINFNLYFFVLTKNFYDAIRSEELHWFLGLVGIATAIIILDTRTMYSSLSEAFRYAFFQVSSIITSTGFATYDYTKWSQFSQAILMVLMLVGACAGSTGGGIKMSRILIMFKAVGRSLKKSMNPNWVIPITLDKKPLEDDVIRGVEIYIMTFLCVFLISNLSLVALGLDMETAFGIVNGTINNAGPGLNAYGPAGNLSHLSIPMKLILCFNMLAGRLEFLPILTLFTVSTWRD